MTGLHIDYFTILVYNLINISHKGGMYYEGIIEIREYSFIGLATSKLRNFATSKLRNFETSQFTNLEI